MMALTECFRCKYFRTVTVTVNGFDLYPLMVISVTVNLNHTALATTQPATQSLLFLVFSPVGHCAGHLVLLASLFAPRHLPASASDLAFY